MTRLQNGYNKPEWLWIDNLQRRRVQWNRSLVSVRQSGWTGKFAGDASYGNEGPWPVLTATRPTPTLFQTRQGKRGGDPLAGEGYPLFQVTQ